MDFQERVLLNELNFNDTDDQIIEYITLNPKKVVSQSIQKTAQELFVVPNSIMRLTKKLGYNGFSEMKFEIKQELQGDYFFKEKVERNCKSRIKEIRKFEKISEELKDGKYFSENILKTLNLVNNTYIEKATKKMKDSKSIKFLGIGESIYFCEMFSKNLRCVGKKTDFFQHRHDMAYSVENCEEGDLYIAISVSGESKPVLEVVEKARKKGAYIISITHFSDNSLVKLSNMNLFFWAPREEKNKYDSTDRVGLMILIRILSEVFWDNV